MRQMLLVAVTALLLLFASASSALPQLQPASIPQVESVDGLKAFLQSVFDTVKTGNDTEAYLSNLEIPSHSAWFAKVFGPTEGARLNAQYEQLLPHPASDIKKHFDNASKDGRTALEVRVLEEEVRTLQEPLNPAAKTLQATVKAIVQPTAIYNVSGTNPQQKYGLLIGDFVYVDGGFRYLNPRVFDALSTAAPLRIRVGGNVQAAKIVHKIEPIYPAEAQAAHISGSCVLHVVIGTDGKVQDITPVSGDATLSAAAVEAVKQWEYQPTLLNGMPVEVDTTITLVFASK